MAARPYHVVVWGANGFTGRLVCEHIAKNYQVRFAALKASRRAWPAKRLASHHCAAPQHTSFISMT